MTVATRSWHMLTDIFAFRYSKVPLWKEFGDAERRLLVQGFRILIDQICPYYTQDGKLRDSAKVFWKDLHDRITMELGLRELSQRYYSYKQMWNGKEHTQSGFFEMHTVCENWIVAPLPAGVNPDTYIKERLSLIEIGFRKRGDEITVENASLPQRLMDEKRRLVVRQPGQIFVPGNGSATQAWNDTINMAFAANVAELNTRFRQAGAQLHYHNGFIQRSTDGVIEETISKPFWRLVSAPKWKNVDTDMKQALDLRDTNGRDPAFYAARALESAIKIISAEKGWTTGKERGAHNYIDNLSAKDNQFITRWEGNFLKEFFSKIRNPMSHGPGAEEMISLTPQQTDWAIENAMSWTKSLVGRLQDYAAA